MVDTTASRPLEGDIFGPGAEEPRAEDEAKVRGGFWRTAKRAARHVPFLDEVVAAYYCALDRKTPMRVRAVLFGSLAYFVLPTDTIPDLILGLGFTDDITVLLGALSLVRGHITDDHRAAARAALEKP